MFCRHQGNTSALQVLEVAKEHLTAAADTAWLAFLAEFAQHYIPFRAAVQALGALDALQSLAVVANNTGWAACTCHQGSLLAAGPPGQPAACLAPCLWLPLAHALLHAGAPSTGGPPIQPSARWPALPLPPLTRSAAATLICTT